MAIASIDNFSLAVGESGARRARARELPEIARNVRGNSHKFIGNARDHGDIWLIPPDRYDTASDAYVGACAINDREASIMKTGSSSVREQLRTKADSGLSCRPERDERDQFISDTR